MKKPDSKWAKDIEDFFNSQVVAAPRKTKEQWRAEGWFFVEDYAGKINTPVETARTRLKDHPTLESKLVATGGAGSKYRIYRPKKP
jgi:hypothetical protein